MRDPGGDGRKAIAVLSLLLRKTLMHFYSWEWMKDFT